MKITITHCSNCPAGRYYGQTASYEGYMCHLDPQNIKCVIRVDSDLIDADDTPLPAECPLRDGDVVIGL